MQLRIIIFNILIVFFLLAAVLFPVSFLGAGMMPDYWRTVWPFLLAAFAALGGMDVFFLLNRRFFALLEKGDWPALAAYLKKKIYQDGKYTSRNVRFLAQSCLLLGDTNAVAELERRAAVENPALVEENALLFGISRIMAAAGGEDSGGASGFFLSILEKKRKPAAGDPWLKWYYGFSLAIAKSFEQAGAVFGELAASSKNGSKDIVVAAVASFFLLQVMGEHPAVTAELLAKAEVGKDRVRRAIKTPAGWQKKTAKVKLEVHGAIIDRYLEEAGVWIFGGPTEESNRGVKK
jgi:hypothetical protein